MVIEAASFQKLLRGALMEINSSKIWIWHQIDDIRRRQGRQPQATIIMEALTFLAVAIGLYFAADKILDRIEQARGARFEQRTVIFFFILLAAALIVFTLIERLQGTA
ncbi:MAG: hypothetical protein OXR84_00235 [Magnetovibrio sp.]|nr:hypothetical protein [Magnetovibrio sp.]